MHEDTAGKHAVSSILSPRVRRSQPSLQFAAHLGTSNLSSSYMYLFIFSHYDEWSSQVTARLDSKRLTSRWHGSAWLVRWIEKISYIRKQRVGSRDFIGQCSHCNKAICSSTLAVKTNIHSSSRQWNPGCTRYLLWAVFLYKKPSCC